MKKYFVIEVTFDGTAYAKAITEIETEDDARMLLHQIMASAIANQKVKSAIVQIIDDEGLAIKAELFDREK